MSTEFDRYQKHRQSKINKQLIKISTINHKSINHESHIKSDRLLSCPFSANPCLTSFLDCRIDYDFMALSLLLNASIG